MVALYWNQNLNSGVIYYNSYLFNYNRQFVHFQIDPNKIFPNLTSLTFTYTYATIDISTMTLNLSG
jgi:hypothetical protein